MVSRAFQEKGVNMVRNGQLREALLLFDKCLRVQLNALGNEHPFIAQTIGASSGRTFL